MDELYYNKVSEEYVETLEDMVSYRIGIDYLLELFRTNIELANWGRIIHQNEYRRLHRSHRDRLTLSAGERYEEFRKQFPQVCQRTLPTLSRLRSRGTSADRKVQYGGGKQEGENLSQDKYRADKL